MSDELNAVAMDHGLKPRHYGAASAWDGHAKITGPCGDTMEYWIEVTGDMVSTVQFSTDGCISSRAAGSMTANMAAKRSLESCQSMTQKAVLDALGGFPEEFRHCALLSTNTLKAACDSYFSRVEDSPYMPEDLIDACCDCTRKVCPALARRDNETDDNWRSRQALLATLCKIRHKIFVLSGKGGVGKSTIAVNLAAELAKRGHAVGLVDADLHGPSIPHMMKGGEPLQGTDTKLLAPVLVNDIKVMSMAYLSEDTTVPAIWRGPMKSGVIRSFITEVNWGELDTLIVDSPPGTGDEALALGQLISDATGAVIVTTPQSVAIQSVSKCVSFCRQLSIPVIGLIENMGRHSCPKCGHEDSLFGRDGGHTLAKSMNVPFLGALPYDPRMVDACDEGFPFQTANEESELASEIGRIAGSITSITQPKETSP